MITTDLGQGEERGKVETIITSFLEISIIDLYLMYILNIAIYVNLMTRIHLFK